MLVQNTPYIRVPFESRLDQHWKEYEGKYNFPVREKYSPIAEPKARKSEETNEGAVEEPEI